MKYSTTKFWVQANEDGIPKNVPHTGKKNYMFIDKDKAKKFLKDLQSNNEGFKFRLVTCKEEYTYDKWE